MSFRDDFLKSRLAKLSSNVPPELLSASADDEEEEEELDNFDVGALPSTSNFLQPKLRGSTSVGSRARGAEDYSPVSGQGFFETALSVSVSPPNARGGSSVEATATKNVFRVYYTPPRNYSAGGSSIDDDDDDDESPVVFVCHHGAGYSAMSFALLARELVGGSNGNVGVLALDARGHGKTKVADENDMDINVLAEDLCDVLKEIFPDKRNTPGFVLVGHSMGGSVVVKACSTIQKDIGAVLGVVNLDVVEGTAMEALGGMIDIINSRPKGFNNVEDAIRWHVKSKTITNTESAKISVPPLFIPNASQNVDNPMPLMWRTDLAATEPYWTSWFDKLSSSFLSQRCAKLLVLAGAETLDKDLMIGQMQGKYQLTVFQDVGHCLQEDAPRRLSVVLLEFWRRNQVRDILRNVKKVGQV